MTHYRYCMKIVSSVLIVLIVVGITSTFSLATFLMGDVNSDERINLSDVSLVLKYVAKWEGLPIDTTKADVNGDGKINISDVSLMLKYLANWEGIEFVPRQMTEEEKNEKITELLNVRHTLRVNENGDFTVLVLSDVQFNNPALNNETVSGIRTLVDRESPDLVIFNGDISFDIESEGFMEQYIYTLVSHIEDKKIPWAHVYGNHDDQRHNHMNSLSKEAQQEIYESFEYCVSKAGEEKLFGVGNFVLPVLDHTGDKIVFNVWCLDSGAYGGATYEKPHNPHVSPDGGLTWFYGHYEPMRQNQIDWYTESSVLLEEYNGEKIPGMMAFHIPLQETYTAWSLKDELGLEWDGERRDNISANAYNCGLYNAVKERGDILAIVNSHDHINDFMVKYEGIRFCYTACIGNYEYHAEDMLGGRVVKFSTASSDDVYTYMSYVNDRIG